ncbi:MAG: hypothetical protein AAFO81_03825 [Pseudomonadota bacterium]
MNERYARERAKVELAMRMIEYEARTNTIRRCTGLSDDRIRKICTQYFSGRNGEPLRRRRGKSPQQIARFVKNASHQFEATTLMHLFIVYGLMVRHADQRLTHAWPTPDVRFGQRLCNAFAAYRVIHRESLFSFEWAWNLLHALARDEELAVANCGRCDTEYLYDRYALDFHVCPACEIRTERRRRPGARHYIDTAR